MKKFKAQKVDLSIQITTLEGKEETLTSKYEDLKVAAVKEIMSNFVAIESNADMTDPIQTMDVIAKELAMIYDRSSEWFQENVDLGTQKDIIKYVAGSLRGNEKK